MLFSLAYLCALSSGDSNIKGFSYVCFEKVGEAAREKRVAGYKNVVLEGTKKVVN